MTHPDHLTSMPAETQPGAEALDEFEVLQVAVAEYVHAACVLRGTDAIAVNDVFAQVSEEKHYLLRALLFSQETGVKLTQARTGEHIGRMVVSPLAPSV